MDKHTPRKPELNDDDEVEHHIELMQRNVKGIALIQCANRFYSTFKKDES